jgi:hypothetical protein
VQREHAGVLAEHREHAEQHSSELASERARLLAELAETRHTLAQADAAAEWDRQNARAAELDNNAIKPRPRKLTRSRS